MAAQATGGTGFPVPAALARLRELGKENPERYRDDAVTRDHDQRRDDLAQRGDRRDVPVAHGGQRHYGPVHALRNAVETGFLAFHEVHHGGEDHHQGQHHVDEHQGLAPAGPQYLQQNVGVAYVAVQVHDAEQAENPQDPDHQHGGGARQDQAEIGRQDGQQVDDAEEAAGIVEAVAHAVETQSVLDGEQQREAPLDRVKRLPVAGVEAVDRRQRHHGDADQDGGDQHQVEPLSGARVGAEDDAE